jgi:hypothetical protein
MRKRIWVWVCWLVLAVTVAALPRTIRAQQLHSEGKRKIIVQIRPALRRWPQTESQRHCPPASHGLARR